MDQNTLILILAGIGLLAVGIALGIFIALEMVHREKKPVNLHQNFYHSNGDDVIESER